MDITISREPRDKAGPDIVDVLLTTEEAAKHRARAEINHNSSSRKSINGNGPKNTLMYPTKLVEVIKKRARYKGILVMYSRSYNRDGNQFTIDSAVTIEAKIPDTRPKVL